MNTKCGHNAEQVETYDNRCASQSIVFLICTAILTRKLWILQAQCIYACRKILTMNNTASPSASDTVLSVWCEMDVYMYKIHSADC